MQDLPLPGCWAGSALTAARMPAAGAKWISGGHSDLSGCADKFDPGRSRSLALRPGLKKSPLSAPDRQVVLFLSFGPPGIPSTIFEALSQPGGCCARHSGASASP